MNIILVGMPGAGKGTVSKRLCEKHSLQHISTGDVLRQEVAVGTALGKKVEGIMNAGELISDDLMIEIIKGKIDEKSQGVIFDGFPRTVDQAKALSEIVDVRHVVFLRVDQHEAIRRIKNRMIEEGGSRADDRDEVIEERLRVYEEKTKPLLQYYEGQKKLRVVDASASIEQVVKDVEKAIELH